MARKTNSQLHIVANGDSWTFGSEIASPELIAANSGKHITTYDYLENNDEYRTQHTWSTHMAKQLNARVTNLAWPADDNGSILRRTISYLTTNYVNKRVSIKDLLVVIGWSSPERTHFWYDDGKESFHFRLWPQDKNFVTKTQEQFWKLYVQCIWNKKEYLTNYMHDIAYFQSFCAANKIKWLAFNAFYQTPGKHVDTWENIDFGKELSEIDHAIGKFVYTDGVSQRDFHDFDYAAMWKNIDPVRFYNKDQPDATFKQFILNSELPMKEKFSGLHPSAASHELWGQELARYVTENKLL